MISKFRTYAIFQFLSILTLICILGVLLALAYQSSYSLAQIDDEFWTSSVKETFAFSNNAPFGIFASIISYMTALIWVSTWTFSIQVLKFKERNLFDSLFLLFFFVPLLSNVIVIFAQMSLKTNEYTSSKIDKKKIEMKVNKKIDSEKLKKEKTKKAPTSK